MRQLQISIAQLELARLEPPLSHSVASKPQQTFKQQLVERYHAVCCSGQKLLCMVTGAQLPREVVKSSFKVDEDGPTMLTGATGDKNRGVIRLTSANSDVKEHT